ncbi:MAG TPA: TetR/AcrR family transcriptional regulator [Usitatibacteraceae bacterium]
MAANRARIIDTAGKLFRERGFDGIGVADLMKGAGLTHGGFYGHFKSKEDLIAQVMARAGDTALALTSEWADEAKKKKRAGDGAALKAIVEGYLSIAHRDDVGHGCAIAALGADASRQSRAVRRKVTAGIRDLLEEMSALAPGRTKAAKRKKALATYASMIGAMVLARAVDDTALSTEILDAVTTSLM